MNTPIKLILLVALLAGMYVLMLMPGIHHDVISTESRFTVRRAKDVLQALEEYTKRYGTLPVASPEKLPRILRGTNVDGQNSNCVVFLNVPDGVFDQEGRLLDGWKRPYRLTYRQKDHSLVIHSFGKNGLDDKGEGDDYIFKLPPENE